MDRLSRRSPRGFTLIELLVVMAIISILASMLFPSFAKARGKARQTVCGSNIGQIAKMFIMYAMDYDGHWPVTDLTNQQCDFNRAGHYVDDWTTTPVTNWAQAVYTYSRNYQIYECPSNYGRAIGSSFSIPPLSYLMNGCASGLLQDHAPDGASTVLLWEMPYAMSDARVNPTRTWFCFFWGWAPHDGFFEIAFQDGHVKATQETRVADHIWNQPFPNMFYY